MKLTPWYLAAVAPIAVAGFSGALLGQFAVLAVTFGIFFGTLSLGRNPSQTSRVMEKPAEAVVMLESAELSAE
ncbi:MAG: hypothetical protein KBF88_04310 [Polyangiaceae bacterium]|nr:hypothetical protein [Polyangiaceae bacterium]